MNQFGLVQAINRFRQRVVVAVTTAAHGRLDTGLGQSFAVLYGHVLRAPVTVMNQRIITLRLSVIQGLFQRVQNEVCPHGTALSPAHYPARVDVNDKGHVLPALPGRYIGEIRNPQLVGPIRLELPVNAVQRAWRFGIADGGAHNLATAHAPQAQAPHQSLDRAAGHGSAFAVHLVPDFVSTIDLHIGLPDTLDLQGQRDITLDACTTQLRVALTRCMTPVTRRGNLQDFANWLDPEGFTVLVYEILQDLSLRSSSYKDTPWWSTPRGQISVIE